MKNTALIFLKNQKNIIIVLFLLFLLLLFGMSLNRRFFTAVNLLNVLEQSVSLSLVSLGQTLTILSAGIDLSVGSLISLLSVLTSGLIDGKLDNVLEVSILIFLIGGMIGVVNAIIIIKSKVHPLIVTLGMGAVIQGVTLIYTYKHQ